MRELELMQKNLEYKILLSEKKLIGKAAGITDTLASSVKNWAFEWSSNLVFKLIKRWKKSKATEEE